MYKGVNKKGYIAKRENQVKKHFTQMSSSEIKQIVSCVSELNLQNLNFSQHSLYKRHNKFPKRRIYTILQSHNLSNMIIEYNEKKYIGIIDKRVVLRDSESYKILMLNKKTLDKTFEDCNLCIVLSLTFNRIITTYWNKCDDNHEQVNMNEYRSDLVVNL